MIILSEKVIESFSNVERIRNMRLNTYNLELEKICKMPAEERIDKLDKMRVLLRLKELYEELDVRVIHGKIVLFKGKAVVSLEQFEEIEKLCDECWKEEKKYTKIIEEEKFILTDAILKKLNDYVELRETTLQDYITNSMMAVIPRFNNVSAFLMNQKEYIEMIGMLSKLNVVIKGQEVYVNEKIVERKGQYFNLVEEINKINKMANELLKKLR